MEWISWLGNLIKVIGDLIPQREKIPPTHRGIKFRGMKSTVVLQPGVYWYWPWHTEVHQVVVSQQTLWLEEQNVTMACGKTVAVRGSITWKIVDKDEAVIRATVDTWDVAEQIDDEAMGVYCDYLATKKFAEVQADRNATHKELTRLVRSRLNEYGVKVVRAQLTTFASGFPLLHMGT